MSQGLDVVLLSELLHETVATLNAFVIIVARLFDELVLEGAFEVVQLAGVLLPVFVVVNLAHLLFDLGALVLEQDPVFQSIKPFLDHFAPSYIEFLKLSNC
jgi:hypothetical protein